MDKGVLVCLSYIAVLFRWADVHVNFFALINLIYVVAAIIIMHKGYQNLTTTRTKKQVALVLW